MRSGSRNVGMRVCVCKDQKGTHLSIMPWACGPAVRESDHCRRCHDMTTSTSPHHTTSLLSSKTTPNSPRITIPHHVTMPRRSHHPENKQHAQRTPRKSLPEPFS